MTHHSSRIREKYFICSQIVFIVNLYTRWNDICKEFQILLKKSMTIVLRRNMIWHNRHTACYDV